MDAVCVRDGHAELQLIRDEVQYTAGLLKTCKAELLEDFGSWYRDTYGVDIGEIAGVSATE